MREQGHEPYTVSPWRAHTGAMVLSKHLSLNPKRTVPLGMGWKECSLRQGRGREEVHDTEGAWEGPLGTSVTSQRHLPAGSRDTRLLRVQG